MTPSRAAVFVCALALAGCGGAAVAEDTAEPSRGGGPPWPGEASEGSRAQQEPLPPEDTSRPLAEPIEGETLDGDLVSLADFRGRPVFIKFFAFH